MEEKSMKKQPVLKNGKAILITEAFPPVSAGSSVLNKNLFSYFDSSSYTVFAPRTFFKKNIDKPKGVKVVKILISLQNFSGKLHSLFLPVQLGVSFIIISFYILKRKPSLIITTIPSYHYAKLALRISKFFKLPLVLYMHDTLIEALHGSKLQDNAIKLQQDIWDYASEIFVMSEGMQSLYYDKYGIDTKVLVHTYQDNFGTSLHKELSRDGLRFFWAGDIYSINKASLCRVSKAIKSTSSNLEFATPRSKESLERMDLMGEHIATNFYPNREDYLRAIGDSDVLILALDWPDESSMHRDELSTIFPTKTPEYLASGRLILVHAPKNYFLSSFFLKYKAGLVVTEKSEKALFRTIDEVMKNPNDYRVYRENAVKVSRFFQRDKVARYFADQLEHLGVEEM